MISRQVSPKWLEIDRVVEAYEAARSSKTEVTLGEFLPALDDPNYLAVLCELVRVDMELGWAGGKPSSLDSYLACYPCLTEHREALQQIAFEHYRQRSEHNDNPEAEKYARKYGVSIEAWSSARDDAQGDLPVSQKRRAASEKRDEQIPDAIREASLAYEQFRLRPEDRDAVDFKSIWTSLDIPEGVIELFHDLHASDADAAMHFARASIGMPGVGEEFLDFLLVAELGRGAFGRVYLARQRSLADRLVVVKISTDLMGESGMLAQLQHTNIVPIYSVHQASPLQAVCMPYFGATTLADVLRELQGLASLPSSGRHFVSTIHGRQSSTIVPPLESQKAGAGVHASDCSQTSADSETPPSSPTPDTLERLEKSTYIDAVFWLGARLAEGLAHAHARGIYHHDLKPANVLFADDGQPMLLDFNLAEDTKMRGNAAAVRVGGTLPYMAPEQLDTFLGATRTVDGRSDIYSLGLILHELLTGQHPFKTPTGQMAEVLTGMIADRRSPPPPIQALNRNVTPAVDAIIRKCLEPDPSARYQSAVHLREDLERQLAHQPLKYVAEPSLRERFGKWRRRHPKLTSATTVFIVAAVFLALLGGALFHFTTLLGQHEARTQMAAFIDEKRRVEVLISIDTDGQDPARNFGDQAKRLLDRYKVMTEPKWRQQPAIQRLSPSDRAILLEEIGNLTILLARAESLHANRLETESGRHDRIREALRLNALASECFESERRPAALDWQEADLRRLLAPRSEIGNSKEISRPAPRTPRDAYLLAFDHCTQGRYVEALPLALQAVKNEPQLFAAHFLLGRCYASAGQEIRAEQEFSTCVALLPEFHWSYFNRGIVRHRLGLYSAAREDFDKCILLQPDLIAAFVERAQVRQGEKDYTGALDDFAHALKHSSSATRVYFLRSRTHSLAGNSTAAKKDLEEGLRHFPGDEQSFVARGLARLPQDTAGALADFDKAIELSPRSRPARQNKAYVLSELVRKVPESIQVLDDVLKDFPEYLPSLGGRGVLLARLEKREAAHADAKECLRLSRRPETVYQVAGIYALTSRKVAEDRHEAVRLLAMAFSERGYGLDLVDHDPDLDPIRQQVEYRRVLAAARLLQSVAKKK